MGGFRPARREVVHKSASRKFHEIGTEKRACDHPTELISSCRQLPTLPLGKVWSRFGPASMSALKVWSSPLLQLRVLRLGLLQDGDVGVGVFPKGKEVVVCLASFWGVTARKQGARQLQLGQRS